MRFSAPCLFVLASAVRYFATATDETSASSLRGNASHRHRVLRPQHECTIVQVETQFSETSPQFFSAVEEPDYKCELHPEDRANAGSYFVSIQGVDSAQLAAASSGETTMVAEGATIMNGVLSVPSGAAVKLETPPNRRRLTKTEGTRRVLVVRAETRGGDTIGSKRDLSDRIFGTHGNSINMRSQYLGCSHNKLDFVPFEGSTQKGYYVTDGVIDVDINKDYRGKSRYDAEDALEAAAASVVGDLQSQFDNVILCVPPGTAGGWIAYAYINSWLSAYNDQWCEKLSTLVHEMGHNLNLAHSGTPEGPYFDKHGMMGYSYNEFNAPKMCFNPPKSWQLGWFDDQSISWNPNNGAWVGTMVGDVDYGQNAARTVILRLETGYSSEIYIGYNRAKGYNWETKMSPDMVTIVEQGRGYSQSTYIGGLTAGGTFTISQFGSSRKDLVVEFIGYGVSVDEAKVAVYYTDCRYPSCCEGPFCQQTTPAPTPLPTLAPTPLPTFGPTDEPSDEPSAYPSDEPSAYPSDEPSAYPSDNPSSYPSFVSTDMTFTVLPTPEPTPEPTDTTIDLVGTGVPELLASEEFRNGLGIFNDWGETVEADEIDTIGVAHFELKEGAGNAPRMNTVVDLNGQTIVSIFFWFKALYMEVDQTIVVRYSIDAKQSWTIVKEIAIDAGQFSFGQWYKVTDILFAVPDGTREMVVQILGRTGPELPADAKPDRNMKSEFVVAGFACLGDSPL